MTTETADYPQMFRQMVVRSTAATLAAIDPNATRLEEEDRERSLYALGLALKLPEAWPSAGSLTLAIAPYMELYGVNADWIDYLEAALVQALVQQDIHTAAKLCLQAGRVYGFQRDSAEKHLFRCIDYAEQAGDLDIQAQALQRLAQIAAEVGDFPLARTYADRVLEFVAEDSPVRGSCYLIRGLIALREANWDAAIDWYQRSWQIQKGIGQVRLVAQAEGYLGVAYRYAKQYDKAVEHLNHSLQLMNTLDSPLQYATLQMELGTTYWYLERYEDALAVYAQCEPVLLKSGAKLILAHLYNNRGLALRDLDRIEEARNSFLVSIEMMRELGLSLWVANAMESLGGLYQRVGNLDEAVNTWQQALKELTKLQEVPFYFQDLITRRITEALEVQEKLAPPPLHLP